MKIANTLMMFFILALTAEASVAASYDDYQQFRKGTYDFELETQYFKSDANYISSGDSFQRLSNGQWYELWNMFLKARYDLSKRSAWYGRLNIATANSAGFDAKRSNSSLADATLGFAYVPYSDVLEVITDFSLLFPFSQVSENTDTVMNNEGVMEGTGLVRLQAELSTFAPYGYIGATYRQERSALLPWGAGGEFHFQSWTLGAKAFGYQSIMEDPDRGNKNQRLIVNDRVNGGSLKFYAVDPSLIDSEIYAKIKVTKAWILSVGGGATLTGAANAAGFHAGIGLAYVWDSQPSYYLRPDASSTHEDALSSEKKVPKFKEEINDGVDQKIFEKKGTPAPKPPPRSDLTPATENVAVKRVVPKPTEALKQTPPDGGDVQLKLRRKRK